MLKKLPLLVLSCILLSGAHAQVPYLVKLADGSSKEILILPCYYPHDTAWKKVAYVKNQKGVSSRFGNFNSQLEQLMQAVVSRGGDIFRLESFIDHKQIGAYNMAGNVFYTSDYEKFKATVLAAKVKKYENNTCAYIVLYRPAYVLGRNDETAFTAIVNDTLRLELKAYTKYIIKLTHEGIIRLSAGDNAVGRPVEINAKFGNTYYVRGFVSYPFSGVRTAETKDILFNGYNPYLLPAGELQGELESSRVVHITLKRTL